MNPNPQPADVPKIIVAVHGIGDQIANTTVQSVAFRVFDYYEMPPAIPLGRFHRTKSAPAGVVLLTNPPDPKLPARIGFAEVYWADIPRELVTKGFTLEEAKQWARTIVARLNVKASLSGEQMDARQYRMLETVLDELVDAIFVLDNLTFLADRAGLFKFDLKKVLDDFLNDVQVVTEFDEFRDGILKKFNDVMNVIANDDKAKGAEIYIVGHSEGSVVAYLGLLNALSRAPKPPAWVDQVRGLMTIGSPIETHLLLWADLWKFKPSQPAPSNDPIVWWNYLDYGDPIAYKLEKTRDWMIEKGWTPFFDHNEDQDVSFARYVLPGKAHVDYWRDKELFAHFLENVVKLPRPEVQETPPHVRIRGPETPRPAPKPENRWFRGLIASVFPYGLVGALIFLAVYFLYTPVAAVLGVEQTSRVTFGNLAGLTLLLAGMTAAVRIPRVTGSTLWWLGAGVFFLAALAVYPILVAPVTQRLINDAFAFLPLPVVTVYAQDMTFRFVILVATAIATVWSYWKPARGVWPLLVPGALVALAIVVRVLILDPATADAGHPSLGPVLLGSAAFLYLWWLATLLFDLSVVWHSHVRGSTAVETCRKMIPKPEASPESEA